MLQVKNLKKYFGGVKAVDGCDFEVRKNTITALIGPNGSGKTTVFNTISGILEEDGGKIIFDPSGALGASVVDITDMGPEKISNLGVSRLFQQSRLFNNLTVKENLLLAVNNEDTKFWSAFVNTSADKRNKFDEKITEMLKLINMEKFENNIARDLSYGQKRLVEIIRTILNPHKLLILDEPVAGVAPALREKIAEILNDLKSKGDTVLLIEHDMNWTLNIADDIIVMEKGKVIAQGNSQAIRSNPRVLEAYLGE